MCTVGEKIKTMRKSLGMTQSELAGEEMTKSMLSQIENNVSNPSMKTLQFIAARLNKSVSYFLEENDFADSSLHQKENEISRFEEEWINNINELIDMNKVKEAISELERLLDSNIINNSYKIYGDILYKVGSYLIKLNSFNDGEKYIKLSIDNYSQGKLYIEAAKAYVELGRIFFQCFKFEECLNISYKAFEEYSKAINRDVPFEIELYYYQIMMLSAIGDLDKTSELIKTALKLSIESEIYFMMDELYRIDSIIQYFKGNRSEFTKSINKALRFAEFREDKESLSHIYIVLSLEALEYQNPENALRYIEIHKDYQGEKIYIYYLFKGRAHYLMGEYEKALENIIQVDFPSNVRHKLDYLIMWSSKIYEGLILHKLGKHERAIEAIQLGIDKMLFFGDSNYLVHAYKSLSEVYSEKNSFENAFVALKKANDIKDRINEDGKIVY
jgi:transcriptional regulator with XRE-family HTH domain